MEGAGGTHVNLVNLVNLSIMVSAVAVFYRIY